MKTTEANTLKERVIELSFYITKAINDNDKKKVAALREEMNDTLDVILNLETTNGKP